MDLIFIGYFLIIGTILAYIEMNMRLFVSKLDGKVSEINT